MASWMESLKMSVREIRNRYTKSEMAIMAWRSGEIASNMQTGMRERGHARLSAGADGYNVQANPELQALENRLGEDVVSTMVDESGEIDLRRLTGNQALRYVRGMGFQFAPGLTRNVAADPAEAMTGMRVTEAYRRDSEFRAGS